MCALVAGCPGARCRLARSTVRPVPEKGKIRSWKGWSRRKDATKTIETAFNKQIKAKNVCQSATASALRKKQQNTNHRIPDDLPVPAALPDGFEPDAEDGFAGSLIGIKL